MNYLFMIRVRMLMLDFLISDFRFLISDF